MAEECVWPVRKQTKPYFILGLKQGYVQTLSEQSQNIIGPKMKIHQGYIHHMMVTDFGIITSDDEGFMKQWSNNFVLLKDYEQIFPKGVVSMAYDKQLLYVINRSGLLKMFDLQQREKIIEKDTTLENNAKTYCIRVCKKPDGNNSLFRSDDKGCLTEWSCNNIEQLHDYGKIHDAIIKSMQTNNCVPDKQKSSVHLYTSDNNGDLHCFEIETRKKIKTRLKLHDGGIYAMDITKDEKKIFTTGFDRVLKEWDLKRMKLIKDYSYIHKSGVIKSIFITKNNRYMLTTDTDGIIKKWNIKRKIQIKQLKINPGILSIAFLSSV